MNESSPSLVIILADYVAPTIGCILSTFTFSAPINSLSSAIEAGSLGSLNPTPWAFMLGNILGWLAYSYITLDLFVFFANAPGLLISIWLNTGAMKLQYYEELVKRSASTNEDDDAISVQTTKLNNCCQQSTPHELKVLKIILVWVIILSTTSLVPVSGERMKFIVGVAVNINLIFFYASPLSTIANVVRTKNSASIHFWTMTMNSTNAFFWCIYSIAIQDIYILIPNGLGLFFGLFQVALYKWFPRSEAVDGSDSVAGLSGDCDEELTRRMNRNVQSEIL